MEFLVIDDNKTFRDAACLLIENEGHSAEGANSGEDGLVRLGEDPFDVVLLDLNLGEENGLDVLVEIQTRHPTVAVILFTAEGSVKSAVEAMRRGAVDFLEKPFRREVFLGVLARVQKLRQLGQRIATLEQEVTESRAAHGEPLFDFTVPAMREVMDILQRAAETPASVLILGESGTGKSVAARALHQRSHLAEKPFVTISCPSLSKELLESELFGHVKGSFTGAVKDRWGKVRAAEGGTLFLDEVGDLPMEIQPKLLRLLQEREYERLGENITRRAEVRIVAATNRDLKARVAEGAFREDLFFRLNVITVEMPPLRARQGDLIRFAEHYLRFFATQCRRPVEGFAEDAVVCLSQYPWPGNLRELRNAIERAVILAREPKIGAKDLPSDLHSSTPANGRSSFRPAESSADPAGEMPNATLEVLEERHIRSVLARAASLAEAAQQLGIDQATLYRKRKKLGLE
ncbi:MAG: sigma-54-dependent Fis family transcriptional regulator [Verrucomicrobiales bacterium]|nr:sigma-54-dependent Fis family transcriptional regulator [Verrucomicrobiales bacterium]